MAGPEEQRKPNPELYAEMSRPYPNAEIAGGALDSFIAEVEEARKRWRIAEVMVIGATHHLRPEPPGPQDPTAPPQSPMSLARMLSLGNSSFAPKMAALLFNRYAQPLIKLAAQTQAMAEGGEEGD